MQRMGARRQGRARATTLPGARSVHRPVLCHIRIQRGLPSLLTLPKQTLKAGELCGTCLCGVPIGAALGLGATHSTAAQQLWR